MTRGLHLDVLGGIAGDMFAGALLDAFPEWANDVISTIRTVIPDVDLELKHILHNDGVLTGSRFVVKLRSTHEHPHDPDAGKSHHHSHRHWKDIKKLIQQADVGEGIRNHAIGIFQKLAEVEAQCHGVSVDDVAFHEVGAWDSIADILAAACLIDNLGPTHLTMSALPKGRGFVSTSHGRLPVPAPATVKLLKGYTFFDDGVMGERITPTGAAIIRYLNPSQMSAAMPMRLTGSGYGFGGNEFPGLCNILRVLVYEDAVPETYYNTDQVLELAFEVDDQMPEDLAVGLTHIRAVEGVVDVMNFTATGKKGRSSFAIRVLAEPSAKEGALAACFEQTTTLGVRVTRTMRVVLRRESVQTADGQKVKLAHRPNNISAKLEMSEQLAIQTGTVGRKIARHRQESESLEIYQRGIKNE